MFIPYLVQAQNITISGNVTSKSGEALENVSIFESKRNIGTITNVKGFFKLTLSEGELNLRISESGYADFSKDLVLTKDSVFSVSLKPLNEDKNRNKKQEGLRAEAKSTKKYLGIHRFK